MQTPPSCYQAVKRMDGFLNPVIQQRLSLRGMACLLDELENFYRHAHMPTEEEQRRLIAAGCRLGSDLNVSIRDRLADLLAAQDRELAELGRQLREKFRQRHQTLSLLEKAQALQNLGCETAESAGLGVIL